MASRLLRLEPLMAARLILALCWTLLIGAMRAEAQVPVIDNPNLSPRTQDQRQNLDSQEKKEGAAEAASAIDCSIGARERGRRMGRSPAEAYAEEARNVALIKRYAAQYGVRQNLALAVAYHESRFDTCAGSPTGVRGVMQLTQRTGRGLGFDRNVNEENIEGGVKYLSIGVARCGAENYTCLSAFYNGSTLAQQAAWASGVRRGVPVFAGLTGDGSGVPTAPETGAGVRTPVNYGPGTAAYAALRNDVRTGDGAMRFLDRSGWQVARNVGQLQGDAQGVGAPERYHDSWDQNARLRLQNASLLNQAIDSQTQFALLLVARLVDQITRQSQTGQALRYDRTTSNPFRAECAPGRRDEQGRCVCPQHTEGGATNCASDGVSLRSTPDALGTGAVDRLLQLQADAQ
jgi:soluble lytic murein transglycosylase-like protein